MRIPVLPATDPLAARPDALIGVRKHRTGLLRADHGLEVVSGNAPSRRSALGRRLHRRFGRSCSDDSHLPGLIAVIGHARRPACSRSGRRQGRRLRSRSPTRWGAGCSQESLNNRAGHGGSDAEVPSPGHRRSPGDDRPAKLGHVLGTTASASGLSGSRAAQDTTGWNRECAGQRSFQPAAARSRLSQRSRADGYANRSHSQRPRSRFTRSELGFLLVAGVGFEPT